MQSSEKTGEPSMEDILASIRKIIADDPIAPAANGKDSAPAPQLISAPRPAPTMAPALGFAPSPHPGAPPAGRAQRPSVPQQAAPSSPTISSLEQDLADLLRDPVEVPPAARPVPAPTAPNSAPLNGAATATGTSANGSAPVASSGLTAWLRGKPKPDTHKADMQTPAPAPTLEIPAAARPEPQITTFPPEPAPTHEAAIAALMATPPAPQSSAQPQPVVQASVSGPTIAPTIAKPPEGKTAEAPVPMQAILERLNPQAAPAGGAAVKAQPVPSPVKSRTFTASPAVSSALTPRPFEANDVPMAPANRPIFDPPSPTSEPSEKPVPVASAVPAVPPSAAEAAPVPAHPTIERVAAPIEAAAEATSPLPLPVEPAVAPAPVEPAADRAAPVEPVTAPVAAIVAALEPSPSLSIVAPSSTPGPVLEDMLAEAMRPMVRQWLDENMRAALEKALRAEMSESLQSVFDKMKVGEKP